MMKQTRSLGHAKLLLATLLCAVAHAALAGSGAVLEPAPAYRAGEFLPEGSTVRTGPDSERLFSPVPGVAVTVARESCVSLLRAAVTKSGDVILSREAVLRLDACTLAFSVDKRTASKTRFEVQAPLARKSVQGLVGTITVEGQCLKLASLSGKMTFTASGPGAPISIKAGSDLAVCGEGFNARIRVINAVAKTWTDYGADGAPLGTRPATAPELESTRTFFQSALAHASAAMGEGLLGPSSAPEIAQTLASLNQSFASAGLAAVQDATFAAAPQSPAASSAFRSPLAPSGFAGASANPANTTGQVNSPER